MRTFERLFVPLDFSASSHVALRLASGLGDPPAQIYVAHAIEPWLPYVKDVLFPYAALGEDEVEFEHELRQQAHACIERTYNLGNLARCHAPEVLMGPAHKALPGALKRVDADLIVMGAFGATGPKPESLGSVTSLVLRHVVDPVLVVRTHTPKPTIKRVVCALDLSAQSSTVLEAALSLALSCGAQMETVYVLPDPLSHDTNNLLASQLKFDRSALLSHAKDKIEALFERAMDGVEVPFPLKQQVAGLWNTRRVLFGDPAKAVMAHADTVDADVVVVGSRNIQNTPGPLLGQTCWSITRRSTTHVMVVPIEQASTLLDDQAQG